MASESVPSPARLRLRERRVDFAMLYREMHYCYGRMIGLDGIALWSWYRLHQYGGGAYKELAGYGWTGQANTMAAHAIKHKATLRRIRDALIEAELLVVREARDVFTPEELEALRERARANGENLSIQPASHLIFAQDPLSREDFVRWTEGRECQQCPVNRSCDAYKQWRLEQEESGAFFDLPSRSNNAPLTGSNNDLRSGAISDHKTNKHNHNVVIRIEPFVFSDFELSPDTLREQLVALGVRAKTVQRLIETPEETAYQLKHLAELKLLGKAPTSPTAWLVSAVKKRYRFTGEPRAVVMERFEQELAETTSAITVEAEQSPEEALWNTTLKRLETTMTRATFDQWLRGSVLKKLEDSTAVVSVPTPAARDWLMGRLAPIVERELAAIVGRPVKLVVEVDDRVVSFSSDRFHSASA